MTKRKRRPQRAEELPPGTLVVAYIRISKDEQKPHLQIDEIKALCDDRGWTLWRVYTDHGEPGDDAPRPDLDKLLDDAWRLRSRFPRAVIVWKLDRLGRSTRHLVNTLHELENELDLRFVSVTEDLDTSTPGGRFHRGLLMLLANHERDINSQRTKSGMEAARRRGVRLGRAPSLSEEQLEQARVLRAAGHSIRSIARDLGATRMSVQRGLSRGQTVPKRV